MSEQIEVNINRDTYDHKNPDRSVLKSHAGLDEDVVRMISKEKNEPKWMLEKRLKALELFKKTPIPKWGPDLSPLKLDDIVYYIKPDERKNLKKWDEVPEDIKKTFDRLGIPEAEKKALSGVGAQYESEVMYHNLKEEWAKQGVIFENMDVALQEHEDLVKKYFMTKCVPITDHKFAMLHAAVWSGGTFIYVPPGVKVDVPLQAYFRMNSPGMGQFEHTLIVVDKGAEAHYIEGCSAPNYRVNSIHAGCVEVYVHEGARARYSSVENWSKSVFNLNTKRAIVQKDGIVEWINGNLGCLTGDTRIFTNPGEPVKIKDIGPGSKVYAWDEKTNSIQRTKVKAKVFSGRKEVFRVEAGGRDLQASANHPFLTLERRKNDPSHKKGFFHAEWKPLEELRPGDMIALAKKLPIEGKPHALPEIRPQDTASKNQYAEFRMSTSHLYNQDITVPEETTDDFMWLMGIVVGDGFIDQKQNKINIATHQTEDYRERLCRTIKKLFNYEVKYKKERCIVVNSKHLCELFTELGFGGTADTKRVPDWVYELPESQILSFLAGYFDADGHAQEHSVAFTSVSKELLDDVKLLGISAGFGVSRIMKHGDAGTVEILGTKAEEKKSWRLLFNGKKVHELPVRCGAKKGKIRKIKTRRNYTTARGMNFRSKTSEEVGFARIDDIVPLGVKPTWDIEVEDYHNFVANGLIVHNSGVTMLYPSSVLVGERAKSDMIGIAFAASGQNQDTGGKVHHLAPNTTSTIQSKSISKGDGICTYRGLVQIAKGAENSKCSVICDALLLDDESKNFTIPYMDVHENKADIAHEATVGKLSAEQVFYLMSRGLSEEEAMQMIVSGFIEPVTKELPLEYAVELNRLIELEMEGSVG